MTASTELDIERDYSQIKLNSGLADDVFARPPGQDFEEFQKQKEAKEKAEQEAKEKQPAEEKKGGHPKLEKKPAEKPAEQPK